MPTYFFNVHNVEPSTDQHGTELPNDEAAWKEATAFAGELFKDIDGKFRPGQDWSLEVTDQTRKPIFRIYISSKTEHATERPRPAVRNAEASAAS